MKRFQSPVAEKCEVMKRRFKLAFGALTFACLALLPIGNLVQAQELNSRVYIGARLSSLNQVPAVLAQSSGRFEATINPDATISFSLTYENMSSQVMGAHIHFVRAGRMVG